jgi:hypothetical protein
MSALVLYRPEAAVSASGQQRSRQLRAHIGHPAGLARFSKADIRRRGPSTIIRPRVADSRGRAEPEQAGYAKITPLNLQDSRVEITLAGRVALQRAARQAQREH